MAPLHAGTMAALVQAANGGHNPILIMYDPEAGHSTRMPVSKQIEDPTNLPGFLSGPLEVRVQGGAS